MDLKTLRQTDGDVVILPGAAVVGDVEFGPDCSVWFNAVLRGDSGPIRLGRGVNVQDNATLHGSGAPTTLGDWVTVGHGAVLHSCTVGSGSLIGMGAVVLDGAVVGAHCLVGAGALVTPGTVIPDGSLAVGSPARVKRALTQEEMDGLTGDSRAYIRLKEAYR